MNASDLQKAKELSKQVASFSRTKPAQKVKSTYFPSAETQTQNDTSTALARQAAAAAQKSAKLVAQMVSEILDFKERMLTNEMLSRSSASSAAASQKAIEDFISRTKSLVPEPIKETTTVIEKTSTEPFSLTEDMVREIVKMMHSLPEKDKLEVSKGIRNAQSFIYGGNKYQVSELMHGGGSSTSSSGFQVPTGTVNGVNAVFTFTTAPSAIVVDGGRAMQKISSDGTVNWTGTTTITLAIAPNFDIFGIA